jgi:hypothetical protein
MTSCPLDITPNGKGLLYRNLETGVEIISRYEDEDKPDNDQTILEKLGSPITVNHITAQRIAVYEEIEKGNKAYILNELNELENPRFNGKLVEVSAIVAATSTPYSVAAVLSAKLRTPKGSELPTQFIKNVNEDDPLNLELIGISLEQKHRRISWLVPNGQYVLDVKEPRKRTVHHIRVRSPVLSLERKNGKTVDEIGNEYKSYDVFVVSSTRLRFEPGSLVILRGKPLADPKNQKIVLLATHIEYPEAEPFNADKLRELRKWLAEKTLQERVDWVLESFAKESRIIGRKNLALAGLLCFFTPTWIQLGSEERKGWGDVTLYGDTTTAKSETIRNLIRILRGGTLITAELASTAGLTATTTQTEREGWFIDWGFLPLCDRKLLAIDGAQKLSASNWAALAESERTGTIVISKAAKGSTWARTRQIRIANPVDKDMGDRYTTKSLGSFYQPVLGLGTFYDGTSIARLDLAVAAKSDVKPEQVNVKAEKLSSEDRDRLFTYAECLKWCWSYNATEKDIKFTDDAEATIYTEATRLYKKFYYEPIPLASIDLKWKIARLSAALAFITLSCNENLTQVTVEKDHVEVVCKFIENEYDNMGLADLALDDKERAISPSEADSIITQLLIGVNLGETPEANRNKLAEILSFIAKKQTFTKDELAHKFSLAEKNELRPLLSALQNEGLIERKRVFSSTSKLIQVVKFATFATFAKLRKEGGSLDTKRRIELLEHYRNIHFVSIEEYVEDAVINGMQEEEARTIFTTAEIAGVFAKRDGKYRVLYEQDDLAKRLGTGRGEAV